MLGLYLHRSRAFLDADDNLILTRVRQSTVAENSSRFRQKTCVLLLRPLYGGVGQNIVF